MINKLSSQVVKNTMLITTLSLGLTGCLKPRGPLHQIEGNEYSIVDAVDQYTKSDFNNIDTTGLELFKIDTLEISSEDFVNCDKLSSRFRSVAKHKNPKVGYRQVPAYGYTASGLRISGNGVRISPGFGWHLETEYIYKYQNNTIFALAQNKVFANEDETRYFIPVEYYGKLDSTSGKVNRDIQNK